jgi:hypothetical protein
MGNGDENATAGEVRLLTARDIDPRWTLLAELPHATVYRAAPRVVVAAPESGVRDFTEFALEHRRLLEDLIRESGVTHSLVVLLDRVLDQDAGARKAWADTDPRLIHAAALVCSSMLARALGAFFLGLRQPKMPTRIFGTTEAALAWAREQSALRTRSTSGE